MGKKLTPQEIENREVNKILKKIQSFEKSHPHHLIERACFRYKDANLRKRKAEKEIAELNKRLERAKKDLRV